jgi:hypothetical protein
VILICSLKLHIASDTEITAAIRRPPIHLTTIELRARGCPEKFMDHFDLMWRGLAEMAHG